MRRIWLALVLALGFGAADAQQQTYYNNATSQITCQSSATLVVASRVRNAVTVVVPSSGSTTYFGGPSVSSSSGVAIAAGNALTLQPYSGPLYCAVSSSTQAITVIETF